VDKYKGKEVNKVGHTYVDPYSGLEHVGLVGEWIAADSGDDPLSLVEYEMRKWGEGRPIILMDGGECLVRVVREREFGLLPLERELKEAGLGWIWPLTDKVPTEEERKGREALIDRWLLTDEHVAAALEAIDPHEWNCVGDCPTKMDFVTIFLYEKYQVIDLVEGW